ncbi:hypothetical protein GBAR_LOCUS19848, partial [Geodia barretti]
RPFLCTGFVLSILYTTNLCFLQSSNKILFSSLQLLSTDLLVLPLLVLLVLPLFFPFLNILSCLLLEHHLHSPTESHASEYGTVEGSCRGNG